MECIDSQPCTQGSVSLLVPLVHSHARAQSGRSSLDREKFSCWVFIRVQVLVPMFRRSVLHFALPLPHVPFGPARAPDHASQAQCRPRPTALFHHLLHHERPSTPPTPTCHRVALDPGSRCYRGGTFSPFGRASSVESFFSQAWKRQRVWSASSLYGTSMEAMWEFEAYEDKAIGVGVANQAGGIPRCLCLVPICHCLPQTSPLHQHQAIKVLSPTWD